MLKELHLQLVGPVPKLTARFGERLNVLTGDNGLGKSFLLDIAFWALTGIWPGGRVALPSPGRKQKPTITYHPVGRTGATREAKTATFDHAFQTWQRPAGRPAVPGLVLYARVDGSFAVWDPARDYWRDTVTGAIEALEQPRAYQFTAETLRDGLVEGNRPLCNGLVRDWVSWQNQQPNAVEKTPFALLRAVIEQLSHPQEPMTPAPPIRVYLDDAREFPTLRMPYGTVPYPHFSAGVQRIVSLAYLLVWAWHEHTQAARLRDQDPTDQIVLLVDEVEAHLHPRWQRSILPALVTVAHALQAKVDIQILAATHSPLILASLEPWFDEGTDRLFWFDLRDGTVHFRECPWAKQGDVVGWLTSDVFGLKQARSREAENAIEAAEAFMRGERDVLPPQLRSQKQIHDELVRVLPGHDPFWPRWIVRTEGNGQ
ncbi:MAG: ATP-binding protein [Gemmataceae bacterium]|nr:ATP-binding protein [Gemmataceae bacterium]